MNRHEQSDDEWSNDEKSGRRVYEFAKIRVLIRSINFYGGFFSRYNFRAEVFCSFSLQKFPPIGIVIFGIFMPASFLNWRDKLNG